MRALDVHWEMAGYLLLLKHLHVICAVVSLSGFLVRGYWMLMRSPMLQRLWVRIAPHVVDTLLLLSGVVMAVMYRVSPTAQPWLGVKLLALLVYIVLGCIALKRGRTRSVRGAALVASVAVFAYIVAVALTRDPLPVL